MSKLSVLPSRTMVEDLNKKQYDAWSKYINKDSTDGKPSSEFKRFSGTVHLYFKWLSSKNVLLSQTNRDKFMEFLREQQNKINKSNGHLAIINLYDWLNAQETQTEKIKPFLHRGTKLAVLLEREGGLVVTPTPLPAPSITRAHTARTENMLASTSTAQFHSDAIVSAIHKGVEKLIGVIERQTATLQAALRGTNAEPMLDILPPPVAPIDVQTYIESLPPSERDAADMAIGQFKLYVRVELDKVTEEGARAFFNNLMNNNVSSRYYDTMLKHIAQLYRFDGPMRGLTSPEDVKNATDVRNATEG